MTTQRQIEAALDVALLRGAQFDEVDIRLILEAAAAVLPTTQRQIEAVARAIAVVWESHGEGYLSAGLFEEMAKAAIDAAEVAEPPPAPPKVP